MINLDEIKKASKNIINEVIEEANLREGDILVLGGSSSEINGDNIGKDSSQEIGNAVIEEFLSILMIRKYI